MTVKSNFTVPVGLDSTTALKQLLMQVVNKLDIAIAKQSGPKLQDNATLQDVINTINEARN